MRVAVFCSSRENINELYKESAQIVGQWIGSHGATLIYGGVDKGLMHIVSSAVKETGISKLKEARPDGEQLIRNYEEITRLTSEPI